MGCGQAHEEKKKKKKKRNVVKMNARHVSTHHCKEASTSNQSWLVAYRVKIKKNSSIG